MVTLVTPGVVPVGTTEVRLTIGGANFSNNAVVVLSDGTQLQPVSVNGSQIVIVVPASRLAAPGSLQFRVLSPCAGFSNTATVRIGI